MDYPLIVLISRRSGANVTLASVEDSLQVTCSRGVKITADKFVSDCNGPFDLIALPGEPPNVISLPSDAKPEPYPSRPTPPFTPRPHTQVECPGQSASVLQRISSLS